MTTRAFYALGWFALLAGLTGGCIVPIPAKARATRSADVTSADAVGVAVVFSPDFAPATASALGHDIVRCISRALATLPNVKRVSQEEFETAFAGKPGEVRLHPDTIARLVTQPDVAQRLADLGVTHAVFVAGATQRYGASHSGGADQLGVAVALQATKSTRLTASIYDVRAGGDVATIEASAEGGQVIAAGIVCCVPFVVGWIPMTESPSCRALGAEVARALQGARP